MNDQLRLFIGGLGTLAAALGQWISDAFHWIGPFAPTLAGLATAAFMLASIAEKFGVFDRFRRAAPPAAPFPPTKTNPKD